jgi:hypothetical protein
VIKIINDKKTTYNDKYLFKNIKTINEKDIEEDADEYDEEINKFKKFYNEGNNNLNIRFNNY